MGKIYSKRIVTLLLGVVVLLLFLFAPIGVAKKTDNDGFSLTNLEVHAAGEPVSCDDPLSIRVPPENNCVCQQRTSLIGGHCVADNGGSEPVQDNSLATKSLGVVASYLKEALAWIFYFFLNIFGLILGMAGLMLDNVIGMSVQKMSDFVNGIPAIELAWKIIRDALNIVILFLLLFSAVGMILRTDKIVPRNILVKIIIAAMLINFSMFFTKTIIDVSNVISFTVYKSMEKIGDNADSPYSGITGAFMEGLDLQTRFNLCNNTGVAGAVSPCEESPGVFENNLIVRLIMGIIVILVTAFVFLVTAIMLVVRFGILIFLIITSPVGFVGSLIPGLQGKAKEWWSTLLGQAFFLPVFLLLLLIVVRIIQPGSGFESMLNTSGISAGNGSTYFGSGGLVAFIQYILIIFFLTTALAVSKSIAGKAGSGLVGFASEFAGKAAFGGAAFVGANTLGRLGRRWAESTDLNRRAAEGNFGAQAQITAGQWLQKKSFDVRGADWAKDLGAGKAAPGYAKRREERAKRMEGYVKKAGPSAEEYQKDKVAAARRDVEYTQNQIDELNKKRESGEIGEEAFYDQITAFNTSLEKYTKTLSDIQKEGTFTDRENALQKEIAGLTRTLGRSGISRIRMLEERIKKENKNMKEDERLGLLRAQLHGSEGSYVDALKKLADVQKEKSGAQKQFKETVAGTYANSRIVGSNKDLADKLRKEMKEKPVAEEIYEKLKSSVEKEAKGSAPAPTTPPAESTTPTTS